MLMLLGVPTFRVSQVDRARKDVYICFVFSLHLYFIYPSIHVYIEIHVFTLTIPFQIQHHRINSSLSPFPFLMLLNLALIIFHIFTYLTNPSVYNKTSVTVTITVLSFMDSLFLECGNLLL